jgi:cyclophilin family peptidyl-prolyl cis-trans isomerase
MPSLRAIRPENKMMRMPLVLPGLLLCFAMLAAPTTSEAQMPLFPRIAVETTHGNFTLELDGRRAPLTTANFVQYVQEGHYEGIVFHRVIPGFMAQAGGFTADLEQKTTRDPVPNESGNGLRNERGTIAMARTNDPHSGAAQFFINLVDNPALDPNPSRWGYAVFGRVVEGMETLDDIAKVPTGPRGRFSRDVPQSNIIIKQMTLENAGS